MAAHHGYAPETERTFIHRILSSPMFRVPDPPMRRMLLSTHAATHTLAEPHGIAMDEAAPNAIDNELRELQFG